MAISERAKEVDGKSSTWPHVKRDAPEQTSGQRRNGRVDVPANHGTIPPRDPMPSDDGDGAFAAFEAKMQRAEIPEQAIRSFKHYYGQLLRGATGYIASEEARPLDDVPALEEVERKGAVPFDILDRTVMIKLNGGLGTTMGLNGPKASIVVKDGLSFLDIALRHVLHMRQKHHVRLPLILMNSYNTRSEARSTLARYPSFRQDVPHDFVQHKVPRIWKHDLSPVEWPDEPRLEWCPPGHGDIYLALLTSGMLDKLLDNGFEYALISNVDNLGATIDLNILAHFVEHDIPILMEAAARTPADRKGGHLARHPKKGLILREIAQCPPDEIDLFQDTRRYRYFNTNNLWVNLPRLKSVLAEQGGMMKLPLIRNEKPVDPRNADTPPVYQLETAMGQAIGIFPYAEAIVVPRDRFIPVKDTNDLLTVWSDAFYLASDYSLRLDRTRSRKPLVDLDKRYYGRLDQLRKRFGAGVPSLVNCSTLKVRGDVHFEDHAVLEGDVLIRNAERTPKQYTIRNATVE